MAAAGVAEKGSEEGEYLGITHLDSMVLHAATGNFVVLLVRAADLYMNDPAKSAAFHTPSFYQFGEQRLNKVYRLYGGLSVLMKPSFLAFVTGKLTSAPNE